MKLTRIETVHLGEYPNLLFVRLHTDEGLIGHGETFYMTDAVRGFIHGFAAPMLLGTDPLAIELHWRRLYEASAHAGSKGVEMRAISALDVAMWDLLAQVAHLPLYQVLGGGARDRIKTYNTCGGPRYGSSATYGTDAGRYDDLDAFMTRADELALDLLSEGITGMKIWPFDAYANKESGTVADWRAFKSWYDPATRVVGGHRIDPADLDAGLEPLRKIRRAVGNRMEIMVEGHGFWSLPAAIKIARALEEFDPFWIEDLMRADDISALAELRRHTTIPVLASEYLMTRYEYAPLIEQRAADIVMIDPTWAGGVTEGRKIASMAETHKLPVAMHDCTGPFTYLAGIHLALNAPNAIYQESVRAYLRLTYPEFVTDLPPIENGHILAPTAPGIGATLLPDVLKRPDATVVESRL